MDAAGERRDIAAGAAHRGRVDVRGVQFGPAEGRGQRGADRTRAAAQVDDDGRVARERDGLLDEEFGTAARHEDAGVEGDAQTVELRPAEDVFEGQSRDAPVHHRGGLVRGTGGGEDQLRLVLGEDTAGGAERGDHEACRVRDIRSEGRHVAEGLSTNRRALPAVTWRR